MYRARLSLLAPAILLLPVLLFASDSKPPSASNKMTPQTRLLIIRDLMAERVFVRTVFPAGETGLELKDGKLRPGDQQVAKLVADHGFAAKPGDRVVISNVVIKDKAIVLEINGGAKKHKKWYQHVELGLGGSAGSGDTSSAGGPAQSLESNGSQLVLAFDKDVPELTGEQVRAMLAPVFDFKALTQAEAYEKTLPPKVQDAIKNHQVLVGMDRDMVIYAKGRPPQKTRDKDENGYDYEEWIYGTPPQEVQFVRFQGKFVTRLEIMTVDGEKIVRNQPEVDLPSQETQVASKESEQPKPANAPTLRRPGEQPDQSDGTVPQTPAATKPYPYPYPGSTGPTGNPTGAPNPNPTSAPSPYPGTPTSAPGTTPN